LPRPCLDGFSARVKLFRSAGNCWWRAERRPEVCGGCFGALGLERASCGPPRGPAMSCRLASPDAGEALPTSRGRRYGSYGPGTATYRN